MATSRISPLKVKELFGATVLTEEQIANNMLRTANNLVTVHLKGLGLNDQTLADIELYLAAHFVALSEERGALTWSEIGDSRERYADIFDQGFHATRFGQQAVAMDTTGTLAAFSRPQQKASFRVV